MAEKLKNTKLKKNIFALIILLGVCFLVFKLLPDFFSIGAYSPIEPIAIHSNGKGFTGSEACAECHLDIYNTHIETAHFKSSAKANLKTVKGSFKDHENIFNLNDSIGFKMEVRNDVLYQDAFLKSNNAHISSSRFDIVIGSGTKGQSYLKWQDSSLYQLQVTYFTPSNSWVNSPGYPSDQVATDRPIFGRCLECHMTYAKSTERFYKRNSYEKSQMVYGIDCERCHGPSNDHVNFHRKNPLDTVAMHVVKHGDLTRQQNLDACALCHSGVRARRSKSPFSFIAGDSLNQFSTPDYTEKDLKNLDVHGNQYGLLSASKCFKKSDVLNCTTCHNPHENQRDDHIAFNKKCQSCHDSGIGSHRICSATEESKKNSDNNCIQCHMPLTFSKGMKIETSQGTLKAVEVRTHLIGIYVDSLSQ
ncbi:multiheme c-type cytochrome [Flavivirga amylovorans]|uniref:Multiheme c-type cytochrome n=1 Tax=Flavivirga amylovorans TaxID=870486 RepID=A0ABT8X2H5_9FLAO|nr:multiheme c-type cytochrome [Flavivirga amylovorans]MDO5988062.1 multiheme c-type cytochrome [Flavivirga amylovorans]